MYVIFSEIVIFNEIVCYSLTAMQTRVLKSMFKKLQLEQFQVSTYVFSIICQQSNQRTCGDNAQKPLMYPACSMDNPMSTKKAFKYGNVMPTNP